NLPQLRTNCITVSSRLSSIAPPQRPPHHPRISMPYLIAVTLLWALSFSLIGEYLAGQVDSYFAVLTRILLACVLFLPLLRLHRLPRSMAPGLLAVGALQFGVTYICLYLSFELLTVPEVLLFT